MDQRLPHFSTQPASYVPQQSIWLKDEIVAWEDDNNPILFFQRIHISEIHLFP